MLQLDSTFSERSYGAGSFRDFAEKMAGAGYVTLRESGRNVLVELKEGGDARSEASAVPVPEERPEETPVRQSEAPRLADGIHEVRRLFQAAPNPPRWPMYVRQVKQYLRGVDPTFDERKFGFHNLNDLLRACQREGLFRIERDRQGVLRFFQGNVMKADEAASSQGINRADIEAAERLAQTAEAEMAAADARQDVVDGDVVREEVEPPPIVDVDESPEAAGEQMNAAADSGEADRPKRRARAKSSQTRAPKEPKEKRAARPRGSRKKSAAEAGA
ncbi:MAG TPA: OST-HTH/LOTUS domain-containing protein, partial [Vicinamibacterales bacterium]|jgi:hypothetical protein